MNKLNLKKNETYKIEVNDNGDYIEFDLTDINLTSNVLNASEKIAKINKEYKKEMLEITKKYSDNKKEMIKQETKCENEKCQKLRIEFDSFLGKGACQKIFGDKNCYGMFNDLLDALEPHFENMKIDIKKQKKKLIEKYMPKQNEVI